ncbi:MAG: DUF1554 domain-containing protein [Thermomicrobiales bacterium]|nr:DUF1554 domain-containing protein [Thermomicrobiales bacterium]
MDSTQFDALAARLAARFNRRSGLGLLAGASLPLVGLAELAEAGKKKKKVTLCLNGQTVKKPKKTARKLLKKGAAKGACTAGCSAGRKACDNRCIENTECCNCEPPNICDEGQCVVEVNPLTCGNDGFCSVFVSSDFYTGGEIGGLAGADAKCQSLADAAGLSGSFKAWLSDSSQSPFTRFPFFTGPWRLQPNNADGDNLPPVVATDLEDLTTCGLTCLKHPINRTETGEILDGSVTVWTNTLSDGTASTASCSNWTSDSGSDFGLFGDASQVDAKWTNTSTSFGCNSALSLYCFELAQ